MREKALELPVLVWDIDDVLNDLTAEWFRSCAAKFPGVTFEELRENPPHEILCITRSDYLASLDAFRAKHQLELVPRPEILDFFEKYGCRYRHVALTAVPRRFAPFSAQWVLAHFGNWIRTFHFVPSPRPDCPLPEYDRDKTAFLCGLERVDCLIDDNETNVNGALRAGIPACLMPRPWNSRQGTSLAVLLEQLLQTG